MKIIYNDNLFEKMHLQVQLLLSLFIAEKLAKSERLSSWIEKNK